ncbi:MAG: NTP transferase domain-containing protein [Calditrichia bacterium]|jgi:mannose-1-phosphate guanylyltransferase|nr:NTP transferase domain-containing protein [Calditrichia bacterium]
MFAVLMAGGVGTRFWPMSRKAYPKQLLNFSGTKSMLQKTYDRIKPLTADENILVVTSTDLKKSIEKQLPHVPKENIIGEPEGKNTAPCIGLAATVIEKKASENEIMVILPADHLVSNVANFRKTLRVGVAYAKESDSLVTLGIQPTYPETGYGYIQVDEKFTTRQEKDIYKVRTFAEKPNIETAERFIKSGDFLWNSGMFIWSVKAIMREIDEHLPELGEDLKLVRQYIGKPKFRKALSDMYSRTKSVSIDYGIMEVAKNVFVIKSDFQWNDLGSWEAVYKISNKDKNGNVCYTKKELLLDAKNNYFYSPKKLFAAVDVEGLVVIDMDDAILICSKEKSQHVKVIVDYLKRKKMNSYL